MLRRMTTPASRRASRAQLTPVHQCTDMNAGSKGNDQRGSSPEHVNSPTWRATRPSTPGPSTRSARPGDPRTFRVDGRRPGSDSKPTPAKLPSRRSRIVKTDIHEQICAHRNCSSAPTRSLSAGTTSSSNQPLRMSQILLRGLGCGSGTTAGQ